MNILTGNPMFCVDFRWVGFHYEIGRRWDAEEGARIATECWHVFLFFGAVALVLIYDTGKTAKLAEPHVGDGPAEVECPAS